MYSRDWDLAALSAIKELAKEKPTFTSDDLYERVPEPPHHNKMGDIFRVARRLGYIEETGQYVPSRRKSAKGRTIRVWRKVGSAAEWKNPQGALI